jgi:hypothetical protein
MPHSQKFNPKLSRLPRLRGRLRVDLVEGEDFKVACPDWCEPVEEAALPAERGWYLVCSLIHGTYNKNKIELDFVYLDRAPDGWVVHEVCTEKLNERKSYWWIGKVKMPLIEFLGNRWDDSDD